jgi:hypothetical protein
MPSQTFPRGAYAAQLRPVIDAAANYEHLPSFPAAREIFP